MKTFNLSRITALLAMTLLVCLSLLISGCGQTESSDQKGDQTEEATAQDNSGESTEPAAEETKTDEPEEEPEPEKPADPPAKVETVEIPSGMNLVVELGEIIETGQTQTGDNFSATLSEPIVVSGYTVFEAGSEVVGYVENAVGSGRLKTDAELSITITSVNGVAISCNSIDDKAGEHSDRNKKLIGGGAVVGGILGALKGKDVKGAVIGAAAGAAIGTGAAVLTGKDNLKYEAGTVMQFTLAESVTVEK